MFRLFRLPAAAAIACVKFYKAAISPLLPSLCKYQPTCSTYFIQAVEKYGLIRGGLMVTWRILRCHPWAKGGWDPP